MLTQERPTETVEPVTPDPVDDPWLAGPRKGVRIRVPALLLTALAVAVFGVWGGAKLQKATATPSSAGTAAGASATGPGGQGGAGGPGGGTSGTVTAVDGNVVTLTTSSGSTVRVTVGDATTINQSVTAKVSDLQAGQTLMVRGTTGTDGSTAATSITVGQAGQAGAGAPTGPTPTTTPAP